MGFVSPSGKYYPGFTALLLILNKLYIFRIKYRLAIPAATGMDLDVKDSRRRTFVSV